METIEKLKASQLFQIKGYEKVNVVGPQISNPDKFAVAEFVSVDGDIQLQTRGIAEFTDDSILFSTLSNEMTIPFTSIIFFDRENNEELFKQYAEIPSTFWLCK